MCPLPPPMHEPPNVFPTRSGGGWIRHVGSRHHGPRQGLVLDQAPGLVAAGLPRGQPHGAQPRRARHTEQASRAGGDCPPPAKKSRAEPPLQVQSFRAATWCTPCAQSVQPSSSSSRHAVCSYMALCVTWHVPLEADLVIVEYNINDGSLQGDVPIRRAHERLLRTLLRCGRAAALVGRPRC